MLLDRSRFKTKKIIKTINKSNMKLKHVDPNSEIVVTYTPYRYFDFENLQKLRL